MLKENIELINKYLNKFPKICLLRSYSITDLKESVEYISKQLGVEVRNITEDLSNNFLNDLYTTVERYVYFIDLDNLNILKQNTILKFIEEPPLNCYILIGSSISLQILPTILTRSIVIDLYKYTKDDLKHFINPDTPNTYNDLLINISNSPDEIKEFEVFNLIELYNFCEKIYINLSKATLPNTLSIANKYICSNEFEKDKYSLNVFVSMLSYYLFTKFKDTKENVVYNLYMETISLKNKTSNSSYNKGMLLENFLLNIWKIVRGE